MSDSRDVDAHTFRRVFSHLPTGVTVITANGPTGPVGMAANSVVSVSLEPPLLLFCPALTSTTWPQIRAAGAFCVNVMASEHETLVREFALKGSDRFSNVDFEPRSSGPVLLGAVAWIACSIEDETVAGDHTIVVARVSELEARGDVQPLVFFRGDYGSFLVQAGRGERT